MNKVLLPLPVMLATALALSGCDEKAKLSPDQQVGPDPVMPKAQDFLMPPMQVPRGVGWKRDGQPAVAQGLKIEKIADGFLHPRMVYVLPNDDILVVESNGPGEEALTTPKQLIAGIVKNQSGKGGKGGNRITLLRKNASGWEKHIFLEHLHSPFGVQLIGDDLYVANTGNIMRYHYQPGGTHISDAGSELADLPSTVNHHWTKALLASPDGKKLYVASARTVISPRMGWILNIVAPPFWRLIRQAVQAVFSPAVSGILPDSAGNRRRASFGPLPMSAMKSAPTWYLII